MRRTMLMKTIKIIAPLAIAAGAAAAIVLSKKAGGKNEAKGSAKGAAKSGKPVIKNAKTGTYSFLSGYKDPVTVDVAMDYDSVKFSYTVIEEEFLSYTSDSHVAAVFGEDFNMQIEYAGYYSGENFAIYSQVVKEKYPGFGEVKYGENAGFKYTDGDNLCICLPIAGDEFSYILVTVIKAKDSKITFEDLPQQADLVAMLSSLKTEIKK